MVKELIKTYKTPLKYVSLFSALILIGLILLLKTKGSLSLEKYHFGFLLLLFTLFISSHFLLVYENWFSVDTQGILAAIKKTIFWVFITTLIVIIVSLFIVFVL